MVVVVNGGGWWLWWVWVVGLTVVFLLSSCCLLVASLLSSCCLLDVFLLFSLGQTCTIRGATPVANLSSPVLGITCMSSIPVAVISCGDGGRTGTETVRGAERRNQTQRLH